MNTGIILNKENLIHNITILKNMLPNDHKFIAVVKGNAYGHGIEEITQMANPYVDGYHVSNINEAKIARKNTSKNIYIFNYIEEDHLEDAMKVNCTFGVFNLAYLNKINEHAKNLDIIQPIHLKIDCLTGRFGIFPDEIEPFISEISSYKNVKITGIYTHLTGLKNSINLEHTRKQIRLFEKAVMLFRNSGYNNLQIHVSSSGGLFLKEIANNPLFNASRVGKAMYGIAPINSITQEPDLKPVLSWISMIAQIKVFPANYPLGYETKNEISRPIKSAVIPIGYSDGFDKKLSKEGEVLIKGTYCKIIGKIAMNVFLVDITEIDNIHQEEEVILIGQSISNEIRIKDLCDKIEATECEILCRISPLLQRTIV